MKKEVIFTSLFIVFNVLNNISLCCFSDIFLPSVAKIFFFSLKNSCTFASSFKVKVTGQISLFFNICDVFLSQYRRKNVKMVAKGIEN